MILLLNVFCLFSLDRLLEGVRLELFQKPCGEKSLLLL